MKEPQAKFAVLFFLQLEKLENFTSRASFLTYLLDDVGGHNDQQLRLIRTG